MSRADGGLTTAALAYLANCPGVWADRRNAGKVPVRGGWMMLAETGTPDILGYIRRPGRYALPFGIETKAKRVRLSEEQKAWHAKAEEWGVPVFTCNSMTEVVEAIRALREM